MEKALGRLRVANLFMGEMQYKKNVQPHGSIRMLQRGERDEGETPGTNAATEAPG